MEIYIVRHAIAVPRGTPGFPNDDRPLTEDGIQKMTRAARGIANLVPGMDLILTSPLQRAHETAKIVARALKMDNNVETCEQLLPGQSIKNLLLYLAKYKNMKRLMLVGHKPDTSAIASALLGFEKSSMDFKKGAICRIDVQALPPKQPGTLIYLLAPKHLRMIGKS
ncbi:MAG: phosphohistidine phosphatase SixA [Ignavibacteriae bacterium]|nr:phosphohistidine phosphatase SixA [Ignavibacteriota bacterium]